MTMVGSREVHERVSVRCVCGVVVSLVIVAALIAVRRQYFIENYVIETLMRDGDDEMVGAIISARAAAFDAV